MSSIPRFLQCVFDHLSQDLLRHAEICHRLVATFILLFLLPICISASISYVNSIAAIKDNTEVFPKEVVKQISRNIRLHMRQIETESNLLVLPSRAQGALARAVSSNSKEQSGTRQDMTQLFLGHYGSVDFINQKYLLDKSNRILDTQAATQSTEGATRPVSRAQDEHAYAYWGNYDSGVGQQNVEVVRVIIGKNNNRQLGSLVLIVRPAHFSTIFNSVTTGSGTQIYTLDASSEVIIRAVDASNDIDALPEPGLLENLAHNTTSNEAQGFVTVEGKREGHYLTAYVEIPGMTWFAVNTITEKKLTAEVQAVRNQIALVGISGIPLSIFLTYFISYSISASLRELVREVHDTGGGTGAQVDEEKRIETGTRARDELSRLAQRLEKICEAVKQKIQKINKINASLEQTVTGRTAEFVTRERKSHTLIESSPDTITRYDHKSRRTYANPTFCAFAGCSLMEALSRRPSGLPGSDNTRVYEKIISDAISSGTSVQFELRWADKNRQEQCSHVRLTSKTDQVGSVYSVLAVGRDLSDRITFEATIWKQTSFDALMDLPNRQIFHKRLAQGASEPGRVGRRVALMLIDLDRFKEVNDPLGRDRGDTLLIEAGKHIGSRVCQPDMVARLGGDEFTVILPNVDNAENVEWIARTIIGKLAEPLKLDADEAFISASVGVTLYPDDAHDLDMLFKNADQAMYAVRNAGRNHFNYFKPDMRVGAKQCLRLINDLRTALSSSQFQVYYQPIIELATGEAYETGALIHWLYPERSAISPHDFIPVTEDTGLTVPIDDWVFKQVV